MGNPAEKTTRHPTNQYGPRFGSLSSPKSPKPLSRRSIVLRAGQDQSAVVNKIPAAVTGFAQALGVDFQSGFELVVTTCDRVPNHKRPWTLELQMEVDGGSLSFRKSEPPHRVTLHAHMLIF